MAAPHDVTSVLARAPLRVSLAGGGTDLPSYADRFGGVVVGFAVNRYVGVTVHPRSFDGGVRIAMERSESVADVAGLRNRFAAAVLARAGFGRDVEVSSFGDVPGGTGMGGSGAFTVALTHALAVVRGATRRPEELAEQASAVEIVDLGRPVGKQDHYLSAFGGVRVLHFGARGGVEVEQVAVDAALDGYLADRLLLFYTGQSRDAGRVLAAQAGRTAGGRDDTVGALHAIRALADDLRTAVTKGDLDDIGRVLDTHWRHKRMLSDQVSSPAIDRLYDCGLAAGAQGGKLLGAGGGGFLLLATAADAQADVRAAMVAEGARELPFELESSGSRAVRLGPI
ncbi:GHMP family kinase ATP-binding protein [Longispora urticae]